MNEIAKTFFAGVIAIGLITAVGLHSAGLSNAFTSAGKAGSGLLGTAEGSGVKTQ